MAATTVEFLYMDARPTERTARELVLVAGVPAEGWVRAALAAS